MGKSRYAYFSALLTAVALQAAVVWQDHATPLASKLACTFVACLGLAVTREKVAEVEQVVVLACLVAGTALTMVFGHLSASSTSATLLSVALTTFTQVRRLLALQLARGAVPSAELGSVARNVSPTPRKTP